MLLPIGHAKHINNELSTSKVCPLRYYCDSAAYKSLNGRVVCEDTTLMGPAGCHKANAERLTIVFVEMLQVSFGSLGVLFDACHVSFEGKVHVFTLCQGNICLSFTVRSTPDESPWWSWDPGIWCLPSRILPQSHVS
jgi:hypothetical protein